MPFLYGNKNLNLFETLYNIFIFVESFSGCSLVQLKCWSGGPEIGGSNPLIPTN